MAEKTKVSGSGSGSDVIAAPFVCELGFSSAKWIFGNIKSRVLAVYQDRGGQKPLIGIDALDSPGGVSYLRTPAQLVRYYPEFLEKCLDDAGVVDKVRVAVGLPAKYYEEQALISGGSVTVLQESLMKLGRVSEAMVLPQGMGGIRDFMGSPLCVKKDGLILGIDFGHNTIIYTLYDGQRSKRVYSDTLYKRGISQMVEHYLMPKIREYTSGVALNPVEISKLMEQGFLPVGTDRIDLKPEIQAAASEYMNHLIVEILDDIKGNISALRPLDMIVFFGGGATYVQDRVKSGKVEIVVLPDPEYANARGFMSYLEEGRQ